MTEMKSDVTRADSGPGAMTRKGITLSQETLVRESFLNDNRLPLVLQPAVDGLSLSQWTTSNLQLVKERLAQSGAILFRGFNVPTVEVFEEFMTVVAGDLLDYSYRSTPRTQVSARSTRRQNIRHINDPAAQRNVVHAPVADGARVLLR